MTNANFHGNGVDVHHNQESSSGSSESLTSTSSRDASSFEADMQVSKFLQHQCSSFFYPNIMAQLNHDYFQSTTRPSERELDIGQAVREASLTAAQVVAASNATIKSLASAASQPWSPGVNLLREFLYTSNCILVP